MHSTSQVEHHGSHHEHYIMVVPMNIPVISTDSTVVHRTREVAGLRREYLCFVVLQQKTMFFLRKPRSPSCTAGQSPSSSLLLSPLTTATARCELRAAIEHTNTAHGRSLLAAHFTTPCLHARTHARARTTDDERRDVRRSAGVADWKTTRRGNTERTLTAAAGSSPCDHYRHALARWPSQKARPFVS